MGRPAKYDHDFPSVTQVVGTMLPKDWEKYWWAKTVAMAAIDLLSRNFSLLQINSEIVAKQITKHAAAARAKVTDDSVVIGQGVHSALEQFLRGKPFEKCLEGMSPQQIKMFSRFTARLAERKLVPVLVEESIYSMTNKVAGTPDYVAREDGKLVLFDWKTSKKIDVKAYSYQMGGYALIWKDERGEDIERGEVWRVGKDLEIDDPLVIPNLTEWAQKFKRMRELYADVCGK